MNATDQRDIELQAIKESLLIQKSMILNKTHEFIEEQSSLTIEGGDEAEIVSNNMNSNISIHLHERDRIALLQIDRALGRISDGTYGQCESCSDEIGHRRLQARPFTTLCIACMEEQEEARNHFQQ